MPIEATAETDRIAGITPGAPWRVKALTVLPGHRLAFSFVLAARSRMVQHSTSHMQQSLIN